MSNEFVIRQNVSREERGMEDLKRCADCEHFEGHEYDIRNDIHYLFCEILGKKETVGLDETYDTIHPECKLEND